MLTAIPRQRLDNQDIARTNHKQAAAVVASLGAVQAQEYAAAKWALALRMREPATDAQIDRAFDAGRILRTHVLRPTWHFVTPSDIRWMLELTAPRVRGAMRYAFRVYGVDAAMCNRVTTVFERALHERQDVTRVELAAALERAGIAVKGVQLALLTMYAELEGVICSGPRRGKQMTYALLAERAPRARRLGRDEALAELTARYFKSHGPATVRDFAWWSGLTVADARRGLDMTRAMSEIIEGCTYWTIGRHSASRTTRTAVHLLPIYDEYLVAYRDRGAVLPAGTAGAMSLQPALVVDGQVVGTWKPVRAAGGIVVQVTTRKRLTAPVRLALANTAARYGRFLGLPASVST